MPTVRSLEFKQVSISRPQVDLDGGEITGRDKDEQTNNNEQRGTANVVEGSSVVRFENGTAEVSDEVAEQLVREYPKSIWVEGEFPGDAEEQDTSLRGHNHEDQPAVDPSKENTTTKATTKKDK